MFFGKKTTFPIYRTCFLRPVGSRGVVRDVKKCKKVQIVVFLVYRPPRANLDAGPVFFRLYISYAIVCTRF